MHVIYSIKIFIGKNNIGNTVPYGIIMYINFGYGVKHISKEDSNKRVKTRVKKDIPPFSIEIFIVGVHNFSF